MSPGRTPLPGGVPSMTSAMIHEASALTVHRLILRNFRSYETAEIHPAPGLNVLTGPNGAGKTNLVEAICYVCLGKSPRGSSDVEMIRRGTEEFAIALNYLAVSNGTSGRLDIRYGQQHGKCLLYNGGRIKASTLYGRLLVTMFTPDDLWILKGPPSGRRFLLDALLVQSAPLYADALGRYRRALVQRNAALRAFRAGRAGRESLTLWDPQLADYGSRILVGRAQAVARLAVLFQARHGALVRNAPQVDLVYEPGLLGPAPTSLTAAVSTSNPRAADLNSQLLARWAEQLRASLRASLAVDIARGLTTHGPQRDDVVISLDGASLRAFGSQGEQRSAVIALKLAERDYLEAVTGMRSVLIVDDVLSELDPMRRELLTEHLLRNGQVFLTTAEDGLPAMLGASATFRVTPGAISAA